MKSISAALVKAQKGFSPALKTSTNPHFRSKYADLSACIEAVIDSLNAAGIALVQQTHECEHGVIVETVFVHESGETLSCGKLHVPATKADAQGYGSALTYARRYSLMAACGIAPEDDDGNGAVKKDLAPVGSGKRATQDAFAAMDAEEQAFLRDLADKAKAAIAAGNADKTTGLFAHLDSDEKAAIWSLFDSTERAAIKKAAKALEAQGVPA